MKKRKFLLLIMSVLFFTLSILSLASNSSNEGYIASFNILRLGDSKKDIPQTAKLLQGFDIVGLVEVMNRDGVEELLDELNKQSDEKWEYHISPFGVGSSKYKEYFAYVYKKDKVKFIKSEGFYKDGKSLLLREPYGATFKIGNFDFTLILVHTIYGNNEAQRKAENFKMVDVYDYFQDKDKNADKITYAIDPAIKTTIGTKGRANSYDNFFFSQKYSQEFTGSSGALDFSGDNPKLMREIISDHIPVFIVVDTSKDDD